MIDFISIGYLIRFHTKNSQKYLYFRKKLTFIRTRYRQNQHLWCQNGVIMSPEKCDVFSASERGDLGHSPRFVTVVIS